MLFQRNWDLSMQIYVFRLSLFAQMDPNAGRRHLGIKDGDGWETCFICLADLWLPDVLHRFLYNPAPAEALFLDTRHRTDSAQTWNLITKTMVRFIRYNLLNSSPLNSPDSFECCPKWIEVMPTWDNHVRADTPSPQAEMKMQIDCHHSKGALTSKRGCLQKFSYLPYRAMSSQYSGNWQIATERNKSIAMRCAPIANECCWNCRQRRHFSPPPVRIVPSLT